MLRSTALGTKITAIIDEYARTYSEQTEGVTIVPVYTGSYQDTITLLWGYAHGDEHVVGMQVLESKETPINVGRLMGELNNIMPEDGIVVADGGFAGHWDTPSTGRRSSGRACCP